MLELSSNGLNAGALSRQQRTIFLWLPPPLWSEIEETGCLGFMAYQPL